MKDEKKLWRLWLNEHTNGPWTIRLSYTDEDAENTFRSTSLRFPHDFRLRRCQIPHFHHI